MVSFATDIAQLHQHHRSPGTMDSNDEEESDESVSDKIEKNQREIAAMHRKSIAEVIMVLHQHPNDADKQKMGYRLLVSLASGNRAAIVEMGGIELVDAAIKEYPANAGVQEWGSRALEKIKDDTVAIAEEVDIEAATKAMATMDASANTKTWGLDKLPDTASTGPPGALCAPENASAIVSCGASAPAASPAFGSCAVLVPAAGLASNWNWGSGPTFGGAAASRFGASAAGSPGTGAFSATKKSACGAQTAPGAKEGVFGGFGLQIVFVSVLYIGAYLSQFCGCCWCVLSRCGSMFCLDLLHVCVCVCVFVCV